MKLEKFGIKPFIHSNVYSGSAPSKVVLNGGLGVSYKVKFLGCKLDFLLTSPNLLASKEDYNPYQIIFNVWLGINLKKIFRSIFVNYLLFC